MKGLVTKAGGSLFSEESVGRARMSERAGEREGGVS